MFHLLAYTGTEVANSPDFDLPAIPDTCFTVRHNHHYLLEDYNLLAAYADGQGVDQAWITCPSWAVISNNALFPNANSAFARGLGVADYRTDIPQPVPKEQEISFHLEISGGANNVKAFGLVWLGTPDWSRQIPRSEYYFRMQFTWTGEGGTGSSWAPPRELVPDAFLRGGVYAVIGAAVDSSSPTIFRLVFPQAPLYRGRELRPGDRTLPPGSFGAEQMQPWQGRYWGEWGRFHTFQLPKIEVLGGSPAVPDNEIILTLAYLGIDTSLLQAGVRTI